MVWLAANDAGLAICLHMKTQQEHRTRARVCHRRLEQTGKAAKAHSACSCTSTSTARRAHKARTGGTRHLDVKVRFINEASRLCGVSVSSIADAGGRHVIVIFAAVA